MRVKAEILIALLVVALGGCRKDGVARSVEVADDIDAIERALSERDRELAEQGIVVAYRGVPPAIAAGPSEAAPTTPDAGAEVPASPPTPEGDDVQDAPTATSAERPPEMTRMESDEESELASRRSRRESKGARKAKASEPTQCERVCMLAQTTCDLRDRICSLASRHFGDIRYASSCQRAEDQCSAVEQNCEACAA